MLVTYNVYMYVCVWAHTCHGIYVAVGGQLVQLILSYHHQSLAANGDGHLCLLNLLAGLVTTFWKHRLLTCKMGLGKSIP